MKTKILRLLEYIKWFITDRGKYTYWTKLDDVRIWDNKDTKINKDLILQDGCSLEEFYKS